MPSTSSDDDIPVAKVLGQQFEDPEEGEEATPKFDPRPGFAEGFAEGRVSVPPPPSGAPSAPRQLITQMINKGHESEVEELFNSLDRIIAEGGELPSADVKDVVTIARFMWGSLMVMYA